MIVITTPTGKIGRQVLEKLLGSSETIRVIARDPSRLPEQTRERIEVVQGSHADSAVVDRAFEGADSVFWVVPPDFQADNVETRYMEFIRPACEAFKSRGVKRVVAVSALDADGLSPPASCPQRWPWMTRSRTQAWASVH